MPTWAVVGIVIYAVIGVICIPTLCQIPLVLFEVIRPDPRRELTEGDEDGLLFIVLPLAIALAAVWPLALAIIPLLDWIEKRFPREWWA